MTKILNFVNGSGFRLQVLGFTGRVDTGQCTAHPAGKHWSEMPGEALSALEEVNGQMAVTVESVADLASHNVVTGNQTTQGIWIGEGRKVRLQLAGRFLPFLGKTKERKKGLFGKKKKGEGEEVKAQPSVSMNNNGMMIPGMTSHRSRSRWNLQNTGKAASPGQYHRHLEVLVMKTAVPPDLSGISLPRSMWAAQDDDFR